MAVSGELQPPKHSLVSMKDFKGALIAAQKGKKDGKYIFDMRKD